MITNSVEAIAQNTTAPVAATKKPVTGLSFLDGLRGLAAFMVLMGHARWLLWEGYSEGYLKHPQQYSFTGKLFVYFLSMFRFGHQSVLFFFVLSGFVIHLKYARSLKNEPQTFFDLPDYLLRRIRRIYPPFIFILVFTWLLDYLGSTLGYSIYSAATPNALINSNVCNNHSLVNLAGNLFFLQNSLVGIWGTNGPLWSLKYEWWFYIVYPLLFLINRKSVYAGIATVVLVFIAGFFVHAPALVFITSVGQYLLCWWLGGMLADIHAGRLPVKHSLLAWLALLLPVLVVFENRLTTALQADVCWAFGFFGLLNFFFYLLQKQYSFQWLTKIKWLGDCSYTLYILHFPVLVFINGLILHYNGNCMPQSMLFVPLGVLLCTLLAWALHFITEKPFIKKRPVA